MKIAEELLYFAAKCLYDTEIAHSKEMKLSLNDMDSYDRYREGQADRVVSALRQYDVPIRGKAIIDLGCNDGALSGRYATEGAATVIGVDIDSRALERARKLHPQLTFLKNDVDQMPVADSTVDVVVAYDVFEHLAKPLPILKEIFRVLRPGGNVVIGTIGWHMPFAPHLWSVMPVPWAHVLVSEQTLLRVCRRIYHSSWYVPNMHDFDTEGRRLPDKYNRDAIPRDYLNHFRVRDFERAFSATGFLYRTDIVTFRVKGLEWLRPFRHVPWLREFIGGSVWFVLQKGQQPARAQLGAVGPT